MQGFQLATLFFFYFSKDAPSLTFITVNWEFFFTNLTGVKSTLNIRVKKEKKKKETNSCCCSLVMRNLPYNFFLLVPHLEPMT